MLVKGSHSAKKTKTGRSAATGRFVMPTSRKKAVERAVHKIVTEYKDAFESLSRK